MMPVPVPVPELVCGNMEIDAIAFRERDDNWCSVSLQHSQQSLLANGYSIRTTVLASTFNVAAAAQ